MAIPRLTTYKFRVVIGNASDPESLKEYEVHGVGRDVQAAETLFAQRGWGKTTDRPMTSAAAVTWAGMRRMGLYAGTFDEFESAYLEITPVEEVTATPTGAVPEPASL